MEAGLCVTCGASAEGYRRCAACRAKLAAGMRRLRSARRGPGPQGELTEPRTVDEEALMHAELSRRAEAVRPTSLTPRQISARQKLDTIR